MDLEKIKNKYSQEDYSQINTLFNFCKNFYINNDIYCSEFADNLVNNIVNNKLDAYSVMIGIIYPAYKQNK